MSKNVKRQLPNPVKLAQLMRFRGPSLNRKKARLTRAATIWDLRDIAKKRTPQGPFDYTDGAAESEASLDRARQAFRDIELVPNILRDVSNVDLTREVFGVTHQMPMGIAPTGFTRLMQTEGEIAGARAAEKFGIPFSLSTLGTTSIEDVVKAAPSGDNWFQLYMWKDREGSMALVERARRAGVKTLHLTVDVPAAGHRLRDTYNGLTIPPTLTVKTLRDIADDPAEAKFGAVGLEEQGLDGERIEGFGEARVGVHRMSGDVEAEKFFFEYEALGGGKIVGRFSDGGDLPSALDGSGGGGFLGGFFLGEHVEEGVLAGGFVAGV